MRGTSNCNFHCNHDVLIVIMCASLKSNQTAHVKARLSDAVEAEPDVSTSINVLGFALHHETNMDLVQSTESQSKRHQLSDGGERDNETSPAK